VRITSSIALAVAAAPRQLLGDRARRQTLDVAQAQDLRLAIFGDAAHRATV